MAHSTVLRVTATLALLAVIIWRSQPQQLGSSVGKLGVASILIAALLTVPFLYLKSLRWLYMLRYAGSEATLGQATRSLLAGMSVALITPARVGEVARVAYLPDQRKLRLSALVMLDKFFDVLVLVLLAIPGAWAILGWPVGVALSVAGVAGLLFTFLPHVFEAPMGFVERKAPLGGRTREVFGSLESLSPAASALYVVLTVGAFALVILQFGLILNGSGHFSPSAAVLTFPLVILTNILPITIAGIGIREGAAILLLGHFHVPAAVAAISAFTMFFLNTALPGMVGAMITLKRSAPTRPEAAKPTTTGEKVAEDGPLEIPADKFGIG
jgi:uncharacterized membrane protein YbhN (UPF0104 family)